MREYIGHESQVYGVEEVRLVGGKGDGMRLLQVRNGSGLEFTLSLDRAADLSRLSLGGVNFGYFAPCGYVSPTYYDREGNGFLKSFTAGFLTTCGLTSVGSPCEDGGERLPLHGTVSHIPAEQVCHWLNDGVIYIRAVIRDASLFGHGLLLEREYTVPLFGDRVTLVDKVTNIGHGELPLQMLYHCNVGYPLLCEDTVLTIPSLEITPRNDHAATGIANCLRMEKPQRGYEEMCYYHRMEGEARVTVYNPVIKKGFGMTFDTAELPYFTEWKMMGAGDYVLGVEPGNTLPDGRDVMRARGLLETLRVGESKTHRLTFDFMEE
ncbi:MAG: aldose 1-epimerase family protein [Clostridia bacterium]|nr:aldose 1-epimerase family protein [Clostridia bacterium]